MDIRSVADEIERRLLGEREHLAERCRRLVEGASGNLVVAIELLRQLHPPKNDRGTRALAKALPGGAKHPLAVATNAAAKSRKSREEGQAKPRSIGADIDPEYVNRLFDDAQAEVRSRSRKPTVRPKIRA